jgi:gluconolactonase
VGSGDGVHIYDPWSPADGTLSPLIGKVVLPTGKGVANFCWAGGVAKQPGQGGDKDANITKGDALGGVAEQYRLLLFAEDELWEAHVGVNGRD